MKIAIQGHPFRGKEVIQILESLGGKNTDGLEGTYNTFYYIDDENEIGDDHKKNFPPTYKLYTLEEFEKEFPFKIGDKVKHITSTCIIRKYCYINNKPVYEVESMEFGIIATIPVEMLEPYKKMKEERNITLTLDKAKEWYKRGGELKEIALQAFTEKELNPLPRSWEEYGMKYGSCCFSTRYTNIPLKYDALLKLEQLRDCWRQGWKPEWKNSVKYAIKWDTDNLTIYTAKIIHSFLVFPTKEMAEEFLECFRDLIEKAGDLI